MERNEPFQALNDELPRRMVPVDVSALTIYDTSFSYEMIFDLIYQRYGMKLK